jgi:lipoyl(octanoyl) transferase
MSVDYPSSPGPPKILRAYLLGSIEFDELLRLQRRLHAHISDHREQAALILCEHPPTISVGRQGSHGHIRIDADELSHRRWPVRWVNRGGGCVLHLPGQLAVYPIFPLDRLGCSVSEYLLRLNQTTADVLTDFSLRAAVRATDQGVFVGERLVSALGVAVRDWVSSFGVYLNVQPPLSPFRLIATTDGAAPMTSLERERRGPVRTALVRERIIDHFQKRFGFADVALFSDHPTLHGRVERCREPDQSELSRIQGV